MGPWQGLDQDHLTFCTPKIEVRLGSFQVILESEVLVWLVYPGEQGAQSLTPEQTGLLDGPG